MQKVAIKIPKCLLYFFALLLLPIAAQAKLSTKNDSDSPEIRPKNDLSQVAEKKEDAPPTLWEELYPQWLGLKPPKIKPPAPAPEAPKPSQEVGI